MIEVFPPKAYPHTCLFRRGVKHTHLYPCGHITADTQKILCQECTNLEDQVAPSLVHP